MEFVKILLFGCVVLTFDKFIVCEDKFQLIIVTSVTEIRNEGRVPYPHGHPVANTDNYPLERRVKLCEKGYELVRNTENGVIVQFLPHDDIAKQKTYVLVGTPNTIDVATAYACPTNFPIYIHVRVKANEDEPLFWVIFKWTDQIPPFKGMQYRGLKLVEDIIEANADEIGSTEPRDVDVPLYDASELTQEQCRRMCKRAMLNAAELGIEWAEHTKMGTNRYYKMDSKPKTPGMTNQSSLKRTYVGAFTCPTNPAIHVHAEDVINGLHVLQAYIKRSDVGKRPKFDIAGYEIVRATLRQVDRAGEEAKIAETVETGTRGDDLTDPQRREICESALKAVTAEQHVLFTSDVMPPVQFYAVEGDENRSNVLDVLKAWECPSHLKVHIHVAEYEDEDFERQVWVIVGKEEYTRLTQLFK